MKILMYADGFGVPTQTFITQDITYLSKNHEIVFVCIIENESVHIPNVTVKKLPFKESIFKKVLRRFGLLLSHKNHAFKQVLDDVIATFQPDVIHGQFGIESLRLIDNLEDTTIPMTIQFRGYDASRMLNNARYVKRLREVMHRENYYGIFVADSLRQNLNRYHINTKESMILHSGIDLTQFKRETTQTENNPFIFLQISSLKDKKGHTYTLKAFAQFLSKMPNKNYLLKLTGDGKEKAMLQTLCEVLQITPYVEFVGFVSRTQAKNLLEEAHVFVHHSITPDDGDEEGIPNALMEAMAMELPVISTYHAGIPELITDGVHGYLVEEKDITSYAQRMQDILSWGLQPDNRKRIEEEFEINYHIKKLEKFYEKMINKPNSESDLAKIH